MWLFINTRHDNLFSYANAWKSLDTDIPRVHKYWRGTTFACILRNRDGLLKLLARDFLRLATDPKIDLLLFARITRSSILDRVQSQKWWSIIISHFV